MQYRLITKDNLKVSALGFGMMRFPVIENDNCVIDKERAFKMLNYLYKNEINYYDTAYTYHCENSETLLGEFLNYIDRERIYIATKLPMWLTENYQDYERLFATQLERLNTDYIDFYLTHSLTKKSFDKMKKLDVFKFLDQLKAEKRIRYAGFSFHDEFDIFKEIIDSYDWDFCQIQLNYLDTDYQAGLKGLHYAREKGISVIIMEPLKGGRLANLPDEARDILRKYGIKNTAAEIAQRWIYDKDISIMLSGMSDMDQIKENIHIADTISPDLFTQKSKNATKELKDFFDSRVKVPCTSCEYCMPCPFGVNIPGVFQRYNNASIYDEYKESRISYKKLIDEDKDASKCTECGHCESLCPQNIQIIDKLKEAKRVLS
ncbi:MAG: aldo/keto reductase [Tissierellia bacterium]|nr:aldo/keto reductase [Tissierellia bacterium]